MALAVNRIYSIQGGVVLCLKGRIIEEIPLPIFGLLSDMPMEALVEKFNHLTETLQGLGAPFADPLRTLVTLTGAAIPFIRICEEGLINIKTGENVDLILPLE